MVYYSKNREWANAAIEIANNLRMEISQRGSRFRYANTHNWQIGIRSGVSLALSLFTGYRIVNAMFNYDKIGIPSTSGAINFLNSNVINYAVTTVAPFIVTRMLRPQIQSGTNHHLDTLFNKFFDADGGIRISREGLDIVETCTSFITLCYQLAYTMLVKVKGKKPDVSIGPERISSPMMMVKHLLDSGLFEVVGEVTGLPKGY